MIEWLLTGLVGLLLVRSSWRVRGWSSTQMGYLSDTADRLSDHLYKFFKRTMIRKRYGRRIIPPHIIPVQALRWPAHARGILWITYHVTGRQSYLPKTTVHQSYLGIRTGLQSYLIPSTVLLSYLAINGMGKFSHVIVGVLLLPLLGLAHSTETSQGTLEKFGGSHDSEDDQDVRDDQQTPAENSTNSDESERSPAYGYVRQSQTDGKDRDDSGDTESTKSQKSNIYDVAERFDLGPVKMFSDLDESGFSFDRDGLNDLRDHLEHNPRPILLDRINRLGRDTLETIYVAAKLHYTYEVSIITHRHGKFDLSSTDDQIMLVVEAISAGKSVEDRIRAAWDTIKRKFKEERVWSSWFKNVRLGYKLPEDITWPKPAPDGGILIEAIMRDTIELQNYERVGRILKKSAYNNSLDTGTQNDLEIQKLDTSTIRSIFEYSDIDLDDIDGSKIKTIVTDPIYIGEVEFPRTAEPDRQATIEDENLQIVDEDLFEEVNDVIDRLSEDNATTTDSIDVQELADLGLLVKATNEVDSIGPICDRCGRGMVKNGTDRLNDGRTAHYWMCPTYYDDSTDGSEDNQDESHSQRKIPREDEWKTLKNHLETEQPDPSEILILRVCPFDS